MYLTTEPSTVRRDGTLRRRAPQAHRIRGASSGLLRRLSRLPEEGGAGRAGAALQGVRRQVQRDGRPEPEVPAVPEAVHPTGGRGQAQAAPTPVGRVQG